MAPKPFFSEIGKKAKDLLTGDYSYTRSVKVTTSGEGGVTFASNASQNNDVITADVKTTIKSLFGSQVEVKIDSASKLGLTVTNSSLAPGLKAVISGGLPDKNSAKLELKYANEAVALTTLVGLTGKPTIEASMAMGHGGVLVGANVGFDTEKSILKKYVAGVGYQAKDYTIGVLLDKLEVLKASYVHAIGAGKTIFGEVVHPLSNKDAATGVTIGGQMPFDGGVVKACINTEGKLAVHLKSDPVKGWTFTVSSAFNVNEMNEPPKIGLGIALKA